MNTCRYYSVSVPQIAPLEGAIFEIAPLKKIEIAPTKKVLLNASFKEQCI